MNSDSLDALVREVDPYHPEVVGDLGGAKQTLLLEITATDAVLKPRRELARRLAGALAAAAVLTAALAVTVVLRDGPAPEQRQLTGPSASPADFAPAAMKAAEESPRLLIDEPGWTVDTVYGFAPNVGTIVFRNGGRLLEMNWRPGDWHDEYRTDRLHVSEPEPVRVAGWPGELFRYSATDFAVMLRPRDGAFVELRGGGWDRTAFDRIMSHVVQVDARTWLAAFPPEAITPDKAEETAAKMLADIPLPPNFKLGDLGLAGDAGFFGYEVSRRVGCAWVSEWFRANRAGDDEDRQRAAAALRGSRNWKVLQDLNAQSDWPESFWAFADKVADGRAQGPEGGVMLMPSKRRVPGTGCGG